jgi:membrane-bound lytic murein transglycosylase A
LFRYFLFFIFIPFLLSGCTSTEEDAPLYIKPVSFNAIPGWPEDDLAQTLIALEKSCARFLKGRSEKSLGPKLYLNENDSIELSYADMRPGCDGLKNVDRTDMSSVQSFFEYYFSPYEARAGRNPEGLFTGYYEASLKGSLSRTGPYKYPLRRRPEDLVMVDLGAFRDDLKGRRIAGRVEGAYLKLYEDRAEIQEGALDDDKLTLVYVDNPVDAFFLHIQGSGRIDLDDGSVMRLGYDGQNGHPYYAIGRELIKRGHLEKEDVSMQTIRSFLETNPAVADEIMNTNKSYIFFRLLDEAGPLGGEGVPLTTGRSLAVDHTKIPYGLPLWVSADPPVEGEAPLNRLMVSQDTGGAIRGAVRGDVFWGAGPRAEHLAGHMKSEGRYWLLLPRKEQKMAKAN